MASIINASTAGVGGLITTADNSGVLQLQTAGTTRQTIDVNGNVGIGVTPFDSWDPVNRRVLEIGAKGSGFAINPTNGNANLQSNLYTTATQNTYANTGYALAVNLSAASGAFGFYNYGTGVAGAVATPTLLASIDASGRVTKPYQPAFFAFPGSGGAGGNNTTAPGSYFAFNALNATFCSSNRSSGYNTSTLVYTAPVAGLYQFYISLYLQGTAISAHWFKNGVGMSFADAALGIFQTSAVTNIVNATLIVELAAGDYVGAQPRAGSPTVTYYAGHSAFWGYLIG